jgi:uroporphyrinogen decarboxylase
MTPMERVLAAVQGMPGERPPFTLTLSLYGARLTGCPLTKYYRSPDRYLAGQTAVIDAFSPEIVFAPFALPLEAEAFGSDLVFFDTYPPNVRKPAFGSPEQAHRLTPPLTSAHPGLSYLKECVALLSSHYRGEIPVCAILTAPVDLPAILFGIEGWLEMLLFDRERARDVLDVMHRHFVGFAEELFAAGANFIALPIMFTSSRILEPLHVRQMILPELERAFRAVSGPLVFHHGGNRIAQSLADYAHLPNVAGFALDHRDSFSVAREKIGKDRLLLGNLNGPTLSSLTPETAADTTLSILTDRARDHRYIFASSAADIPWETPRATIESVVRSVLAFRRPA